MRVFEHFNIAMAIRTLALVHHLLVNALGFDQNVCIFRFVNYLRVILVDARVVLYPQQ